VKELTWYFWNIIENYILDLISIHFLFIFQIAKSHDSINYHLTAKTGQ
jgi:hypothetical protein